jgi:hypothetical protein
VTNTSRGTAHYAPRTRGGLLVSCIGFAALAASSTSPGQADAVSPVMGLGFVAAILSTVYLPRLIRPGAGWCRSTLPARTCATAYVTAGLIALAAAVAGLSFAAPTAGWFAAAVILAGGAVVTTVPLARSVG